MANRINPSAANILSSLGIKGATTDEPLEGYVPVLGPDGKLDVRFIPDSAAKMAVPPVSDVAFVDAGTPGDNPELRNGSAAAPYKTIAEAASNFDYDSTIALILAPGVYTDSMVTFKASAQNVYIISIGNSSVYVNGGSLAIGVGSSASVTLHDIVIDTTLSVTPGTEIILSGKTRINTLSSSGSSLKISSEARVDSTNVTDIELSTDSDHVANGSSVPGANVGDALDRLDARKIRVLRVSGGSSGVDEASSYVDVSAESAGGFDVYDLRGMTSALVSAVKELFRRSVHVEAEDVTAGTVTAGVVSTRTISIDAITLGGYRISVDAYGYLVVSDGVPSPARPPDGAVLLRDESDGSLWLIFVEGGRLYVERFYEDSSDSDSELPYQEYDYLELVDSLDTYRVSMSGGRLVIDEGSSI